MIAAAGWVIPIALAIAVSFIAWVWAAGHDFEERGR